MAIRGTNTMVEVLQRMLTDLAQAKTLMDADLPFILSIETMLVDKLRDPVRRMEEQGLLPPGSSQQQQPQQQGPPQGMPQGMPPQGGPSFQGQGVPGIQQTPAAPNADELGRLMNAGQ